MNNNEKLAGEEGLSSKLWSSSDQGTLFADVVDFKTSYLDAAAALEALLEAVAIHRSRHIVLVRSTCQTSTQLAELEALVEATVIPGSKHIFC